jgi:hypothetical protein
MMRITHGRFAFLLKLALSVALLAVFWTTSVHAQRATPPDAAPQGLMPFTKDIIQILSWGAAIIGGLIAAFKAIAELRENRHLRARELRWKQAELAKELLDDLFTNQSAKDALQMIDFNKFSFKIQEGKEMEEITRQQVLESMNPQKTQFTSKELFIRDRFDTLYYYIDRLERSLKSDLVIFDDIQPTLYYYVRKMSLERHAYEQYLSNFGFPLTLSFLNRFLSWKNSKT